MVKLVKDVSLRTSKDHLKGTLALTRRKKSLLAEKLRDQR
jgi:hypothetical protein